MSDTLIEKPHNNVWFCSNLGTPTPCVYCEKNNVSSNTVLSICSECKPKYKHLFDWARKMLALREPHETLYDKATELKTEHANQILADKKKAKEEKSKMDAMEKEKKVLVATKKAKISLYNPNNKKKMNFAAVKTIAYVLPCFSSRYMPKQA